MLSRWPVVQNHLARRAARGDGAAFRSLYRALHPQVHAYVGRRVAIAADAEDLVARVFHRMLEHLDRYDPDKASVRAWVLAIARNAVIDHHRTRREHTSVDDVAELLEDGSAHAFEPDDDERARAVRVLVDELPPATREMLALHFVEGLRYREIAAVCGASEAAVKQRMARTLRDLRAKVAAKAAASAAEKGAAGVAI
ncbi:MAG TPA: RNA polymerase sigma factor [Nannocystaceae bacterium]|nr:RNA polymerase sigma factor [Nannocystaceae bacterium]